MKNSTIFSAFLIGASAIAFSASAQDAAPDVPGSEEIIELNQQATRDAVADNAPAADDAAEADATTDTIVPGSEAQIEMKEADERNAVAAGTNAETTGEMAADGKPLVPGSGATMSETGAGADVTTTSDTVQDEAPTETVN